jgi:glycosyltransferase involved in cell wall biosynthesis
MNWLYTNKLFEYLQAGLPVISTDLPAMKDVIEKYSLRYCRKQKFIY